MSLLNTLSNTSTFSSLVQESKWYIYMFTRTYYICMCACVDVCITSFCIIVTKHHDQGNLKKEGFIWGLALQKHRSQPLSYSEAVGTRPVSQAPTQSCTAAGIIGHSISNHTQQAKAVYWKGRMSCETSKPTSSDTLPPARPHLFNLRKQCHQLRIEYSDAPKYMRDPFQTTTMCKWIILPFAFTFVFSLVLQYFPVYP